METNKSIPPASCTSLYHLLATNLLEIQMVGNYVKGYLDGKDTVEQFLKEYCEASNTKFTVRSSHKKSKELRFSKRSEGNSSESTLGTRYGQTERIYWEFNNRNLYVPFTGIPFVINSSQTKHCQYGAPYYKQKWNSNKVQMNQSVEFNNWAATNSNSAHLHGAPSGMKRRQLKQSKKRSCTAYMYVREIVMFPDFAVRPEILSSSKPVLRNEKLALITQLRKALQPNCTIKTVNRFYVEIPLPEAHCGHSLRIMNPSIKAKLDELIMFGRYEQRHIRLIVQDHMKEMFKNGSAANQLESFPSETEISDYIQLATACTPTVVEVHTKEYGANEGSYQLQQTSTHKDMEKSLKELKSVMQSCADEEKLCNVKLQVKRMIQKLRSSNDAISCSSQLGKRPYSSLDKHQTCNDFTNHSINAPMSVQHFNSNVCNHSEVPLTLPQASYGMQNQLQFQTKDPNSVLTVQQSEANLHAASNDMLTSFSRFMESDQDILPSLVDQVITDSSNIRPAPNESFSYFSQYPSR